MPAGPPIAWMFAARLAWVRTTPLGWDVEPEVNWSSAGALGSVDSAARARPPGRGPSRAAPGTAHRARPRPCPRRCRRRRLPRHRRAPAQRSESSRAGPLIDQLAKVLADLSHGADRLDVVQRDRDVEAVLELGNQLEEEQGVEAEVEREIALGRRLDPPSADSLHDRDDLGFEHVARDVHRFPKRADRY